MVEVVLAAVVGVTADEAAVVVDEVVAAVGGAAVAGGAVAEIVEIAETAGKTPSRCKKAIVSILGTTPSTFLKIPPR